MMLVRFCPFQIHCWTELIPRKPMRVSMLEMHGSLRPCFRCRDGVISQSVTVASEAVLMGVPTLLVSDAERGFLDRLEADGYPLFRLRTGR